MSVFRPEPAFTALAAEGGRQLRTARQKGGDAMGSVSRFTSGLVSEEIRRIVAEAAENKHVLSASDAAATILKKYPKYGFDEAEIANEVMLRAAQAGVGVQIGRPTRPIADLQLFRTAGTHSDRIETL